jgi:hypothetical protein
MVEKGETPVRSLLLHFCGDAEKFRRKRKKNETNLIVINEECPFCESTANASRLLEMLCAGMRRLYC